MIKTTKLAHNVGASVQWKWLGRAIHGVVKEVHFSSIERTLKGKKIKRNGSQENPAYLVESVAGNQALKLHSELSLPSSSKIKGPRPKMFG